MSPLPNLDNSVPPDRPAVVVQLLPHDVAVPGGEVADDVQQLLDVHALQLAVVASQAGVAQEGLDLGVSPPATINIGDICPNPSPSYWTP